MSAPLDPLPLAAEFPPATRDQWIELVTGVLRRSGLPDDADPVAALTTTTYDGIPVRPLYTAADVPPAGTPGSAPVRTRGDRRRADADRLGRPAAARRPRPGRLRAGLLNDLETGATSLWLVLGEAGLPVADLPAALDGVYLDLAPIALDAGAQTAEAAAALLRLVGERGLDPAEIRGSLGADPIGLRARTGAAADLGLLTALRRGLSRTCSGRPSTRPSTTTPAPATPRSWRSPPRSGSPTCGR